MPLSLPTELKKITPFIRRAEELDRNKSNAESRLVAYYCRQYAVHTGIALAQSPAGKTALGNILNDLEKEKQSMSAFTREESKFLCRQFADKIFNKADEEDRAGQAGKNTAKTFYAAASFLEILLQFYNQDEEGMEDEREEISKKIKYTKWKSTEILKAIKEGRTPTPGGYEEETQEDEEEEELFPSAPTAPMAPPPAPTESFVPPTASQSPPVPPMAPLPPFLPPPVAPPETVDEGTEIELGPPPSYPGSSQPVNPTDESSLLFVTPSAPQRTSASANNSGFFGFGGKKNSGKKVSKESFNDAIELTRFALAALESKDSELAANRLSQALNALGK